MSYSSSRFARAFLYLAACVATVCCQSGIAASRPWTVNTSIEMTSYIEDIGASITSHLADPIVRSPDGKAFYFVTRRGDLQLDANIYELHVFKQSDILRDVRRNARPKPFRVIACVVRSSAEAFSHAQWIDGGKAIAYISLDKKGLGQVYRLDLATGTVTQSTTDNSGVADFAMQGRGVIYESRILTSLLPGLLVYPAHTQDRDNWASVVSTGSQTRADDVIRAAWGNAPAKTIAKATSGGIFLSPDAKTGVYFSPDGKTAVASIVDRDMAAKGGVSKVYLVDLVRGRARNVAEARLVPGVFEHARPSWSAFWSADGRHVAIVGGNSHLSLPSQSDEGSAIDLDINGVGTPIFTSEKPVDAAEWTSTGRSFSLRANGSNDNTRFEYGRSGWVRTSSGSLPDHTQAYPPSEDRLNVSVRQATNSPPQVVVSVYGREITISDPDRALYGVAIAEAAQATWTDPRGQLWRGGLLRPSGANTPLPLVVQLEHFDGDRFQPDGSATTAYSAQELVAAGFAVLRLDNTYSSLSNTPAEGPAFVEALDTIIEQLAGEGTVDSRRVGLIGFSHYGFLTEFAITHPGKIILAAAIAADPGEPSYISNLGWSIAGPSAAGAAQQWRKLYGGLFWTHKDAWLAGAPGFNADKVRTPLLTTVNGYWNLPSAIELHGALTLLNSPAEFIVFPLGEHQLQRPAERFASQSATIDWMNFWLRGYEDPLPSKLPQYERWRKQRDDARQAAAHWEH